MPSSNDDLFRSIILDIADATDGLTIGAGVLPAYEGCPQNETYWHWFYVRKFPIVEMTSADGGYDLDQVPCTLRIKEESRPFVEMLRDDANWELFKRYRTGDFFSGNPTGRILSNMVSGREPLLNAPAVDEPPQK